MALDVSGSCLSWCRTRSAVQCGCKSKTRRSSVGLVQQECRFWLGMTFASASMIQQACRCSLPASSSGRQEAEVGWIAAR
jgi:hypothetical protein